MAEPNGFQKFIIKAVKFFKDLFERIKKADRRFVIMIVAAVVVLIVILGLIVHGVRKNDDKPLNEIETTTEEQTADSDLPAGQVTLPLNGVGKYRVETGSDSALNMRIAASSTSEYIARIPNGTPLEVMFVDDSDASSSDGYGWGYVEYNGERGWVFMEYLVAE